MFVNPATAVGISIGLGGLLGTSATASIVSNINKSFNNGQSVVFGNNDPSLNHFKNFCQKTLIPAKNAVDAIQRTLRRMVQPQQESKYYPITSYDQFEHVTTPMQDALIFAPYTQELFLNGQIGGWDIPKDFVKNQEDVWGRLINNGTVEVVNGVPSSEFIEHTFRSTDPDHSIDDLDYIDLSRGYIDSFLQEDMGKGGERRDPTSWGDRIKLM